VGGGRGGWVLYISHVTKERGAGKVVMPGLRTKKVGDRFTYFNIVIDSTFNCTITEICMLK